MSPSADRPVPAPMPHVVVVGGGIAGLAAAARLTGVTGDGVPRARVTVLEADARTGGKLLGGEVGGVPVDLGAESLFAARPGAFDLARRVGLGADVEAPLTSAAAVWTRGALRELPKGQLMGIPGDLDALAASGVLSPEGVIRACWDLQLPRTEVGEDIAIGPYVAARMGREVVDRLVEPLLGGVYAGHADALSLRAALPRLLPVARETRSLAEGVRELLGRGGGQMPAGAERPGFRTVRGGMGRLPEAVAEACRAAGADIRTGTEVRELCRTGRGWLIRTEASRGGAADGGPGGDGAADGLVADELVADGVVLAVPAPVAARLLAGEAPGAAADLAAVEYADMALVTLVFRRSGLAAVPSGSGFLVPPVDGRTIKAATFFSNKWRWSAEAAPDAFVVRTSVGRHGEDTARVLDDAELVARARADLAEAAGLGSVPYATAVTRWPAGLPQYPVGHFARVERIRELTDKLGGLALCGAAYDGVGIAACVAGGERAAGTVVPTA
ncbi:protoporphyrinogen oxidase [Streptomyces sp. NPDC047886]|uniref:protoporphyrinogen oxidase n=1 Tax=Streptomyces sp. NPDC047886 TaxID=3365490 RepID=UPI0037151D68